MDQVDKNKVKKSVTLTIFLGFLSFYYLSLYSFTPNDSSWYSIHIPVNEDILNDGGELGVYLSSVSFYLFGLCSYLLPLVLVPIVFSVKSKKSFLSLVLCSLSIFFLINTFAKEITLQLVFDGVRLQASGVIGNYLFEESKNIFGMKGLKIIQLTLALIVLNILLRGSNVTLKLKIPFYKKTINSRNT